MFTVVIVLLVGHPIASFHG